MKRVKMDISYWRHRYKEAWRRNLESGSITAQIYTEQGVVEVFTFPGDHQHEAFTRLKLWLHPHHFTCTLPRHYHERWLRRLAHWFAWDCQQMKSEAHP